MATLIPKQFIKHFTSCRSLIALALIMLSALFCTRASAQPFTHPGILHNQAELDFVTAKIKAGEEPWKSAWEALKQNPYARLDWRPTPVADVFRGPYNNPDVGSTSILNDSGAAYTHALAWVMTSEKAHAGKAAEIVNAWSATLKTIKGHDARLLVGMSGLGFINAAELLRHTGAGWAAADQKRFEELIRNVLYPIIKDFFPGANGNWDAAMIQTMLAMGIFLDDRAMFERAVNHCRSGKTNGAIGYYFSETGECQESGRDQGHTQMGLGYLGCACEIAWKQGVDLYGTLDNRLARGFEYTAKYNLGHDVPYAPYRSVAGNNFYPELSPKSRGRFSPIYAKVYHHYHDRMGLAMPFTREAMAKVELLRNNSAFVPWDGLMFTGLPGEKKAGK